MKNIMKLPFAVVLVAMTLLFSGCSTEAVDSSQQNFLKQKTSLDAHRTDYKFQSKLRGDNEVPPVATDAVGQAIVSISRDGSEISYKLIVANLDNPVASHFHMASEGINGPVVAFLFQGSDMGTVNGVLAEGTITSEDVIGSIAGDLGALKEAIRNGMIYVNVHTVQTPSGELRGQL